MLFAAIRIVGLTIVAAMIIAFVAPGLEATLIEFAEGVFP